MNFNTIKLDEQVVDSLRFFYMLTIYLSSKGWGEERASRSLTEYMAEVQKNGYFTTSAVRNKYCATAWSRLPSDFLNAHDIPLSLKDGIRIVDSRTTWIQ
jgi:hypothetical protein